ncbi:MAG: SDR family NAD(P)-dependent oxidoreductase [Usitatibacter sp.]
MKENLYIVTGTTKGLGRAFAEQIASDKANDLVSLTRAPSGAIPGGTRIELDLADTAAIEKAFDAVEKYIAGKSYAKAVLINNAAVVTPMGALDQVAPAEIERNIVVNLVAPMLLMRRFLRATQTVQLRRIINISSGLARRPMFGSGCYCASKAGLDMASRAVLVECETRGMAVEVSSLAPGVIDTPMQVAIRGASPEEFVEVERFKSMKAEGKLRPPGDVAADILRLEAAGKLKGDPIQDLRQLA